MAFSRDFRKKTVLIDADLQKPGGDWFQNEGKLGLIGLLKGEATLESVMVGVPGCDLTVIPKGNLLNINPIEVLNRNKLEDILRQLKGYFDIILVDCPPILQVASTNVIAELMDANVMVVKAGETPRLLTTKAQTALEERNIIGVVFNNTSQLEIPLKYYYSYSYSNV